jgi:magnesium transporter
MAKTGRTTLRTRRRAPVGAPPGTLIRDEHAAPTTINLTVIAEDTATEIKGASLADIKAALAAKKRMWVDVVGLSDIDTLRKIAELFSIDPLALEDIVNTSQRPKSDAFTNHAMIIVQMFEDGTVQSREQFSILFDSRNVVSFQERPGDCLDPVRKRLASPASRIRKRGAAYLVYALLDTILDAYFPLLERIGDRLEEMEDEVTNDPQPDCVRRLHQLKRELQVVKHALWPTRELLSGMTRGELHLIPDDVTQFLRDLQDHAVQLIDVVESYRELSNGLLDLYLSSVSTKMNEVMKVLTIVSTIFIPLSFLAGVWGMNFDPAASPWNMPELHAYYGYPAALLFMAVVALGLFLWVRLKKWL